ncbi:MAG: AAA family ATPase [Planctomycetota bacterium]|nr:AAA family ATPase [Planctomycetota bacterium]
MIKRLTITDFKSIRNQTIEFGPVTVLVGRSGTGKSNIVQALRFLRNYIIASEPAVHLEGGWSRIVPAGIEQSVLSFDVLFNIEGMTSDYRYKLVLALQPRQMRIPGHPEGLHIVEEQLMLGDRSLYDLVLTDKGPAWRTEPALVGKRPPAQSLMIRQLPAIQDVVYAYAALSAGIGYYSLPNTVLGRDSSAPNAHQNHINEQLPGLRDDATNYLQVMKSIVQDLHQLEVRKSILAALRQLNPSLCSVEMDSVVKPTCAVVGHQAGSKVLEIGLDQESDGFRRFYAHLLALYQRPPKLLNIFEEPENGIYPGALSLLAGEFRAAPAAGRGQVILTTHSPGLLDHFGVDDLRVVDMRDGETIVGRVAQDQRKAVDESLLTTGELLTVDQARIDEPETSPA